MDLDRFDRGILAALQDDASLTTAALAEAVALSPSQCSRRRIALEKAGLITGYRAELNATSLGYTVEAFSRVTLAAQSESMVDEIAAFFNALPEVRMAYTLTGDADYLLHIHVRSLDELANFVHRRLLPHPMVAQVRSDIVLQQVGRRKGVPL
ncbi:Lrp/AsnC family transcriptional regulator [Pikeienuella sp. HZG-20]|uniref:Lrp/AsnC family transcriptional regulator n=1 Tax=Paludibacillus litoralis TaxID=3133267 RepID=UPI0030EF8DE0